MSMLIEAQVDSLKGANHLGELDLTSKGKIVEKRIKVVEDKDWSDGLSRKSYGGDEVTGKEIWGHEEAKRKRREKAAKWRSVCARLCACVCGQMAPACGDQPEEQVQVTWPAVTTEMVIALGVRMKGEGPQGQRGGERRGEGEGASRMEGGIETQSTREAEWHKHRMKERGSKIQEYSTAEGNMGRGNTQLRLQNNTAWIHSFLLLYVHGRYSYIVPLKDPQFGNNRTVW